MAERIGHAVPEEGHGGRGRDLNALKSWAELRAYMEQKDRIFLLDALDLYGFLQAGTTGPYTEPTIL